MPDHLPIGAILLTSVPTRRLPNEYPKIMIVIDGSQPQIFDLETEVRFHATTSGEEYAVIQQTEKRRNDFATSVDIYIKLHQLNGLRIT